MQALKVFLQFEPAPQFQLIPPAEGNKQKLIVKESTQCVRPHLVGAVLRNITFTPEVYASFIDLQVCMTRVEVCSKFVNIAKSRYYRLLRGS